MSDIDKVKLIHDVKQTELKGYLSENFFGSMMLEKLSLMLLQQNCINVVLPLIEKYGLNTINWHKNFKERAFDRCYDEFLILNTQLNNTRL